MLKALSSSLVLALLTLSQVASAQILKLVPLPGFGTNGDGTIRAEQVDFLDEASQIQRGMAWNPVTGHLMLVTRTNTFSPTYYRMIVLDGITGEVITNYNLTGLVSG